MTSMKTGKVTLEVSPVHCFPEHWQVTLNIRPLLQTGRIGNRNMSTVHLSALVSDRQTGISLRRRNDKLLLLPVVGGQRGWGVACVGGVGRWVSSSWCYVSNWVSSARTSGVSCLAALAASAMARRYGPFLFLSKRDWKLSRKGESWVSGRKEVVGEPNQDTLASCCTASPVSPRRDTVMPSTRAGHQGKP